jgi:hypothetical protein
MLAVSGHHPFWRKLRKMFVMTVAFLINMLLIFAILSDLISWIQKLISSVCFVTTLHTSAPSIREDVACCVASRSCNIVHKSRPAFTVSWKCPCLAYINTRVIPSKSVLGKETHFFSQIFTGLNCVLFKRCPDTLLLCFLVKAKTKWWRDISVEELIAPGVSNIPYGI